jgi:hypothetical protein
MSNHFPRVPVRFVPQNADLVKSQDEHKPNFDAHQHPVAQYPQGVVHSYRVPHDRNLGCELFRRYPDGSLDLESAKHTIVAVLHRVKDSGGVDQLNQQEKNALSILFPTAFDGVAPDMGAMMTVTQLKISPAEAAAIRISVAQHLLEEMNYSGGQGGGSVVGRGVTRA